MAGPSRWADDAADAAETQRRKAEKEEKKRQKLAKQQAEQEAAARARAQQAESDSRPSKRRRLSNSPDAKDGAGPGKLLRFEAGGWGPCRHVGNFETLNQIEEGSYGWVSRAKEIGTGEVVALKKVKMDYVNDGFPITALREIAILQKARHRNIVELREVVMGDKADEVVLVMEFLEHDLKTLQEDMAEPFLASEIKTLLRQLAEAVDFLHTNHIMHRDLKTSNILLSHRGTLKLADFGMSRLIPPPHAPLTTLVVTLWYRAPELLLGAPTYTPAIDMWSYGCIFGELLLKTALLPGKNEVDQLALIFALCGLPNEASWPAFARLPHAKSLKLPRDAKSAGPVFRTKFATLTNAGVELLTGLLSLDPGRRPSAKEVLGHAFFREAPKMKPQELFPTFPSRAGRERKGRKTPDAPKRGERGREVDFSGIFGGREEEVKGAGFMLRMA